ncbi:N-formylglutamate deformylase [uncultured Roseobacter sp.]|uniref:N-formylglutamate deformylase n=1 Tax=uncultured Roseobacter sp. TaxID=114847 RepID=UPI002622DFDD|nr:N-formylglutamate deformylase [uncultured Roseobacter sp.]
MPVDVTPGDSPLILAFPHSCSVVPEIYRRRLNPNGQALRDTDWHVDRLYSGLAPGATTVRANFHRYVSDANRDPSGQPLYPGQHNTGLVPLTDFDGQRIWDDPPTPREMATLRSAYHVPYHAALSLQIARVQSQYGFAVLWDCHSIRSHIPKLFTGLLPDFNIGTASGASCDKKLTARIEALCRAHGHYTVVVDGRFKGGWTTRRYGNPARRVHAVQMEIAQSAYLASENPPWTYDEGKAERLRAVLGELLTTVTGWRPDSI